MLILKNIVKDYVTGDTTVRALKGVSINFRENEFVSILGPSGCGKTTMLNIIGGLDRYTSGDLLINGKSTKRFKDRDWDVYRNHRIGFVFQSYNLIPHQTVLSNVELALTLSGVSKKERRARAQEALKQVGLENQMYKKPSQMSGGQMQRVAIARALINDPDILLADEPTGALDTETSVQIMDLIKEISAERLVIMVTHNPELAEKYSNRIVRLLDGEIIEDSNPFSDDDEVNEVQDITQKAKIEEQSIKEKSIVTKKTKQKKERAKMSFFTAFMLSARNLISKKGRTVMVGIAGSIGIIGIALVLAFSAGIKGYVASMQDDMLSGNPITITEQTYDLDALTGMMNNNQKQEIVKEPNRVYIDSMVEYFIKTGKKVDSLLIKNDITEDYINYVQSMPSEYYSAMKLGYGIDVHNNIFTKGQCSLGNGDKVRFGADNTRPSGSLLNKGIQYSRTLFKSKGIYTHVLILLLGFCGFSGRSCIDCNRLQFLCHRFLVGLHLVEVFPHLFDFLVLFKTGDVVNASTLVKTHNLNTNGVTSDS